MKRLLLKTVNEIRATVGGSWDRIVVIFKTALFLLASVFLLPTGLLAQPLPQLWSPITDLASGGIVYMNLAASGSTVHAAHGNGTLWYRRSLDEGATWLAWQNLGTGLLYLEHPIAASGPTVAILTVDKTFTITDFWGPRQVGNLYLRISKDNGATFSAAQLVTTKAAALRDSIAISGSTLHLAWMDYRNGSWDIYYQHSTDFGITWQPEVLLVSATNSVGASRPSLLVEGPNVHLTWMDARDNKPSCAIEGGTLLPFCTEIYYKRSLDGGVTWGADQRITNDTGYAGRPDIAVSGNSLTIAYDRRPVGRDNNDTALTFSTDNGATWSFPQLVNTAGESTHPVVRVKGTQVLMARMDGGVNGLYQIFFRSSTDNGATWSGDTQLSSVAEGSAPVIARSDNYVHVVWGSTFRYRRKLGL